MGFQILFFSFLLSSRRKSAAAIAINVPVSSRKSDVFPFCNASADAEAADGFSETIDYVCSADAIARACIQSPMTGASRL